MQKDGYNEFSRECLEFRGKKYHVWKSYGILANTLKQSGRFRFLTPSFISSDSSGTATQTDLFHGGRSKSVELSMEQAGRKFFFPAHLQTR